MSCNGLCQTPGQSSTPLNKDVHSGIFPYASPFRGRVGVTSPGTQLWGNNVTGEIVPWTQIGSKTINELSDIEIEVDWGSIYGYLRRARIYNWADFRVLVNGGVVSTHNTIRYMYLDQRSDTNPNVINPIRLRFHTMGRQNLVRQNLSAGDVVSVEIRVRSRMAAAQPSSWVRQYGCYRSQVMIREYPKQVITDVS